MAKGNQQGSALGGRKYSNRSFKNEGERVDDFYETFDSGDGVTVPDGMEEDFAHMDSGAGLNDYCMNDVGLDGEHGAVPEVPRESYRSPRGSGKVTGSGSEARRTSKKDYHSY